MQLYMMWLKAGTVYHGGAATESETVACRVAERMAKQPGIDRTWVVPCTVHEENVLHRYLGVDAPKEAG